MRWSCLLKTSAAVNDKTCFFKEKSRKNLGWNHCEVQTTYRQNKSWKDIKFRPRISSFGVNLGEDIQHRRAAGDQLGQLGQLVVGLLGCQMVKKNLLTCGCQRFWWFSSAFPLVVNYLLKGEQNFFFLRKAPKVLGFLCPPDIQIIETGLLGGLEQVDYFPIQLGLSSSQLTFTPSFFRGVAKNHQPVK